MHKPSLSNFIFVIFALLLFIDFSQCFQEKSPISNNILKNNSVDSPASTTISSKTLNSEPDKLRDENIKNLEIHINELINCHFNLIQKSISDIDKKLDQELNKDIIKTDLNTKIIEKESIILVLKEELTNAISKYAEISTNQLGNIIGLEKSSDNNKKIINDDFILQNSDQVFLLDIYKFKFYDWVILSTFGFFLLIAIPVSRFAFNFIRNIPFRFRSINKIRQTRSLCVLSKTLDIRYNLLPAEFDIMKPWCDIVVAFKNTKKGDEWNQNLVHQLYEAIEKNRQIKINDLAFFFGKVWSMYVFQFEHDTEFWQWSEKTINDSLPPECKMKFALRLPAIGSSYLSTTSLGISISTTGSGPKIKKITYPGCEITNCESGDELFSMSAFVEMGD